MRHDHYQRNSFGTGFGGASGCVFGVVFAVGTLILGTFLVCAGCIGLTSNKLAEARKEVEQREAAEAKARPKPAPKGVAGKPAEKIEGEGAGEQPAPDPRLAFTVAPGKSKPINRHTVTVTGVWVAERADPGNEVHAIIFTLKVAGPDAERLGNSWASTDNPTLRDPAGNELARRRNAPILRAVIPSPGEVALLFDSPPADADAVYLYLPSGPAGGGDKFEFRCPRSQWKDFLNPPKK